MGYIMLVLYALFVAQDLLRYELSFSFLKFKSHIATDIIMSSVSIYEAITFESLPPDLFALMPLYFVKDRITICAAL